MPRKITFSEFKGMLADINVPDSEIAKYLVGRRNDSRPFQPAFSINTKKVEVAEVDEFVIQGAFAMNWANGIARRRREERFRQRRESGDQLPVIVSEGDSWSQFPFLLRDVIDHLEPSFLIHDVAAAGDTLENMIWQAPEYERAIDSASPNVRAFLFSGAGNDYMGEEPDGTPVLAKVLRHWSAGMPPAWYLETPEFDAKLSFVRESYRKLLARLQDARPDLPVVLHGYDYAIPHGGADDARRPIYAKRDGWLAAPLRSIGVKDPTEQAGIVRALVDRLNEMQIEVCAAFPMAHHVDLRGTLPSVSDWADELHPTDAGYGKVARKIKAKLKKILS